MYNEAEIQVIKEKIMSEGSLNLILSGGHGLGQLSLVKGLIKEQFCDSYHAECLCDSCQKVDKELHPDIIHIRPDGAYIKKEQIAEMQRKLYFPTAMVPVRYIVIEESELMTESAQNALLKSLEMDSINRFILITHGSLLETIYSRAINLKLSSIPYGKFKGLKERSSVMSEVLYVLSDGAYQLAEDIEASDYIDGLIESLGKLLAGYSDLSVIEAMKLFDMVDESKKKPYLSKIGNAKRFVKIIRQMATDVLLCSIGVTPVIQSFEVYYQRMATLIGVNELQSIVDLCSTLNEMHDNEVTQYELNLLVAKFIGLKGGV